MSMALEEQAPPGKLPSLTFIHVGADSPTLNKLQADLADIVRRMLSHSGQIYEQLVDCSTVDEFKLLRGKFFEPYLSVNAAIANIVSASNLDPIEYASMTQETIRGFEDEFSKSAPTYLGQEEYEELFFCLSTHKSASRLLPRLRSVAPSDKQADDELREKYFRTSCYVFLHIECLSVAMKHTQPLHPFILKEILAGIRQAVMLYSYARAGLDLRDFPASRYSEDIVVSWDEEDEALSKAD